MDGISQCSVLLQFPFHGDVCFVFVTNCRDLILLHSLHFRITFFKKLFTARNVLQTHGGNWAESELSARRFVAESELVRQWRFCVNLYFPHGGNMRITTKTACGSCGLKSFLLGVKSNT